MLRFHGHPLASFCHKPLIALYESGVPFEFVHVDLADAKSRADFAAIWPMAKMPALEDTERGQVIGESVAVIEYIAAFHPGALSMIPEDPDEAWRARMWNSFHDSYLQAPMQKIVADTFRPEGSKDPAGVAESRALLRQTYDILERELAGKTWNLGDRFSLADCSAAPALFYSDLLEPLAPGWPNLSAYLDRLMARPSYARVLQEAEPWFPNFPLEPKPRRVRTSAI